MGEVGGFVWVLVFLKPPLGHFTKDEMREIRVQRFGVRGWDRMGLDGMRE